MNNEPPYFNNVFFLPKSPKIGKTNIFWPSLSNRKMQKFTFLIFWAKILSIFGSKYLIFDKFQITNIFKTFIFEANRYKYLNAPHLHTYFQESQKPIVKI
jgi:hypothetical protein